MLQISTSIAGLAIGGAYALIGLSTLLTYRLVAVVNFAQAGVGAFGAFVMVVLWDDHGVALALAVTVGVLVGAAIQATMGIAMNRWFSEGTEEVKSAVTVALLATFLAVGERFFGSQYLRTWPDPLGHHAFTVAGVGFTWLVLFILCLSFAFALGPTLFLKKTRTGLLLRAMSSKPTTSELVGVRVPRLSLLVWTFTGAISTFAIMIVAPQVAAGYSNLAMLITWGLAAALIGRFRSFWWTLAGGLGLGVLQGFLSSMQSLAQYRGALPFVVIIAILVWTSRHERWDAVA